MYVGTIIKDKMEDQCIGVCIDVFIDKNEFFAIFLFEDRTQDCLNIVEMNQETSLIGFCKELEEYEYIDEESLNKDFEKGVFDLIFKKQEYFKYSSIKAKEKNEDKTDSAVAKPDFD